MKGDKDSLVVILNKTDYIEKLENMVKESTDKGTYTLAEDNTVKDLKNFKQFLKQNFKGYDKLDDILPTSTQPARLYATAKTHKFSSADSVNINDLKFRPIINQTGTMTYNAAKVISDYLRHLCKNKYIINDTLSFADMIERLPPLPDDEECVSSDVVSLFTNVPLDETIDYIIESIYTHKKLPQICSKLVFRRLLEKITKDCTFQLCFKFYKQVDGCVMGGPLSVTLSDIYMSKMEDDVVEKYQPKFYKRYVDDIIYRRKKNQVDLLFNDLNNYHQNIKLTLELHPKRFLDINLEFQNGILKTSVHLKETKWPTSWNSKIAKKYKHNVIIGDLHRSKRISTNFTKEKHIIKNKFKKANFPTKFIDSVIKGFEYNEGNKDQQDDFIIAPNLFEEPKPRIVVEIPFCELNEKRLSICRKKFNYFINDSYDLNVVWKTKKVKSFFPLKDKNLHPSCKFYYGLCSCGDYVGETKRNVSVRYDEHNKPSNKSKPAAHLEQNNDHYFTWRILCNAPSNTRTRKNIEAFFIAIMRPSLNEQIDPMH